MKNKLILTIILVIVALHCLSAKEYKASLFGIRSDGTTNNTGSIQKAVDYISEQGGGTLVFYVGRYLTGTILLKSDVSIRLEEGAILVGSLSPYDYEVTGDIKALLIADSQSGISVSGKGVIDGQGERLMENIHSQLQKGFIPEPVEKTAPSLIAFHNCRNFSVEGINLVNSCGDVFLITGCHDIKVSKVSIKSHITVKTTGILITASDSITIRDSYFDLSGKEIEVVKPNNGISLMNCINAEGKEL
jgi:polygalacturonase